jgi:hypothetical protein
VYYMFSADHTNELRYFDESRNQEVTIPLPAALGNTFGWSPSQRYLAVQVRESKFHDYPGAKATRKAWVMIYDSILNSVRRVTTEDLVMESEAIWINDNQLVFLSRSLKETGTVAARWVINPESGSLRRCEDVPGLQNIPELLDPANAIVRLKDNTVLVVREDQVSTLDIVEPKLTRWADWLRGKADGLEWIRPDSAGREVLFCAKSSGSTNRNVFRVSMESGSLQRLTDEHSYNGKWIEGGRGFAYVGNTNNCFYLAVRPAATKAVTNLFTSGWVRSYWPNPAGTAIYAEASLDAGPCGLWKYELATQQLRQLRDRSSSETLPLVRRAGDSHLFFLRDEWGESANGPDGDCYSATIGSMQPPLPAAAADSAQPRVQLCGYQLPGLRWLRPDILRTI